MTLIPYNLSFEELEPYGNLNPQALEVLRLAETHINKLAEEMKEASIKIVGSESLGLVVPLRDTYKILGVEYGYE